MIDRISQDLLFTKNDPRDPRLGEFIFIPSAETSLSNVFADKFSDQLTHFILGYPDDAGVKLNGGRIGTAEAPDTIRRVLYKSTPLCLQKEIEASSVKWICDLGNISSSNFESDILSRHELGRQAATEALKNGKKWLALGGGHDYGYCEGTAFLEIFKEQRPIIINFDAHLDVRPFEKQTAGTSLQNQPHNQPHSGTPFFRLLNEFTGFELIEIGIQKNCNSPYHIQWAREQGVKILFREDQIQSRKNFTDYFLENFAIADLKNRPIFISVDLDMFSHAEAPGTSASWPLGVQVQEFFELYWILLKNLEVNALGLYEVSPPLDSDNRTSKLAAQIANHFLFAETLK